MKKLKLYLETSVWNFLFADDAPNSRGITLRLFKEIVKGFYEIYTSDVTIAEISDAPANKRTQMEKVILKYQPMILEYNEECEALTKRYMELPIIPPRFERDAQHIAIAVVNNLDVIISWNLRHIVKVKTRREVNAVNKLAGYKEIDISTPEEVIGYEI